MSVTHTRPTPSAAPPGTPTGRLAAARVTRDLLDNGLGLAFLVVALLTSNVLPSYPLLVLTLCLVYTVALVSIVVLTGYIGQVSLCQASFMGLGGFLAGALMGHFGWSYWVAAPVACVLVFLVGVVVGLPALRLRGLTLAIVTLSLALLADYFLFVDIPWLNHDSLGWTITRPYLFGISLETNSVWVYRVVLIATALALLGVLRLRRGRTGKCWFAMRDAEIAASTSGVQVVTMKLLGFGVAAALGALAGVLYILVEGSVTADRFNFIASIQLLAIAVIAGVRSLPGAVLGALFYILAPQLLLNFPSLVPLTSLILGVGLIVQVITAPQGLGGVLEATETRLFRRLAGDNTAPSSQASERGAGKGENDAAV